MISDEKLEEIIRDRFKILGSRSARLNKDTLIFELKAKYGDSLDDQKAKDIYENVRTDLIQKDGK